MDHTLECYELRDTMERAMSGAGIIKTNYENTYVIYYPPVSYLQFGGSGNDQIFD